MTRSGKQSTRVMILADRRPVDLTHGRDLRIHHLLVQLAGHFDCFVVDLSARSDRGA